MIKPVKKENPRPGGREPFARIDRENMLDLLRGFPGQCEDARRRGGGFRLPAGYRKVKKVLFTGLGGSAIGADLVKTYLAGTAAFPIIVNRDYRLPALVDGETLVVVSSYSGNTEETLSAYDCARRSKAKIVVVTSGGELRRRSARDRNPCLVIPAGYPPRCALGYSFFSGLLILEKLGLIPSQAAAAADAIRTLKIIRDRVAGPEVGRPGNAARKLARRLADSLPVIYAAESNFAAVATRWRSQLAENSKTLASSHLFPELDHNEIVGWEFPRRLLKRCVVIILRDRGDHGRVRKRMDITAAVIRREAKAVLEVWSRGRTLLARMFSLIYLGDFVSFYLAVINRRDPTPVERIAYLKKKLAKR